MKSKSRETINHLDDKQLNDSLSSKLRFKRRMQCMKCIQLLCSKASATRKISVFSLDDFMVRMEARKKFKKVLSNSIPSPGYPLSIVYGVIYELLL